MQAVNTDPRSIARIIALQALCQFDAQGDSFSESLAQFVKAHDDEALPAPGSAARQAAVGPAQELAMGTWRARAEVDRRIGAVSTEWRVERMAPVDRNTLRLAVYELLHRPQTPFRVAIDEAIELARMFGDADSGAFVNGVLDAAWRAMQAELSPTPVAAGKGTESSSAVEHEIGVDGRED